MADKFNPVFVVAVAAPDQSGACSVQLDFWRGLTCGQKVLVLESIVLAAHGAAHDAGLTLFEQDVSHG